MERRTLHTIQEGQGIRQGGTSSTGFFKSRANKTLSGLEDLPSSLHIRHIKLGAVMVADNLAVMSDTRNGLQDLVYEAQSDASRERYI